MKRLFYAIVALSLFTISCSKNDAPAAPETVTVSFTVTAPEMQTRSGSYTGDGSYAEVLYYAFYDEDWNLLAGLPNNLEGMGDFRGLDDGGYTIEGVKLVKDRKYHAIFWAQSGLEDAKLEYPNLGDIYTVDLEKDKTVTLNPANLRDMMDKVCEVEHCDAFYATITNITTENPQNEVFLKRPFAQLNIATTQDDYVAGEKAGAKPGVVRFETVVPTRLNLTDGSVDVETKVDFGWSLYKMEYEYNDVMYWVLSYGYILCGTDDKATKNLQNITFKMSEYGDVENANADAKVVNRTFENVPIQRNCRTYILGELVTGSADATTYEINIVPDITTDNVVNAQAQ